MKITDSRHRLKELLNESGDTQNEMARKTGLTKSAISNYINGTREPRQDAILKISNTYNVNPAWLMGCDVPKYSMEDLEKNIVEQHLELFSKDYEDEDLTAEQQYLLNATVGNYHEIKKAMELYELYEKAEPSIKTAIETLLKRKMGNE